MDIRIDNYRLTSDERNFIISEIKVNKTGKHKGEEVDTRFSYHATISDALEGILTRQVKQSTASTLNALKIDLKRARKVLQESWNTKIKTC